MNAKQLTQNTATLIIAAILFLPLLIVGIPLLKLWLWAVKTFGPKNPQI
jgi:uncharacterized MAPEG superfamily protein